MLNIICEKKILNEAVTPALSAVSTKSTDKALDGFLLTADKDSGTLTVCGYDLEKGVKVTVSGENIEIAESGSIIVSADKFASVIKNIPDGSVSVSVSDKLIITVTGGKSEFTLHGLDSETFPVIPALKGEKSLKLSRQILKNMIASTLFSVASNSSRPALNGVLFEIKNNRLNVVSCDGNRLSLRRSFEGITSSEELDLSFIVPGKSLSELLKLIGGDDEKSAEIGLTSKHVIISFDNIIFFSRLIESEFLDYNRIVKIDPKTTVTANTRSLYSSVDRSAVLTDDRQKTPIKLSFNKTEVNIENKDDAGILQITSSSSIGSVNDECDIEIHGDDMEVGFNQKYLSEALKAVKEEKAVMNLESPMKSVVILPYDKESAGIDDCRFIYLILPVMLKSA